MWTPPCKCELATRTPPCLALCTSCDRLLVVASKRLHHDVPACLWACGRVGVWRWVWGWVWAVTAGMGVPCGYCLVASWACLGCGVWWGALGCGVWAGLTPGWHAGPGCGWGRVGAWGWVEGQGWARELPGWCVWGEVADCGFQISALRCAEVTDRRPSPRGRTRPPLPRHVGGCCPSAGVGDGVWCLVCGGVSWNPHCLNEVALAGLEGKFAPVSSPAAFSGHHSLSKDLSCLLLPLRLPFGGVPCLQRNHGHGLKAPSAPGSSGRGGGRGLQGWLVHRSPLLASGICLTLPT